MKAKLPTVELSSVKKFEIEESTRVIVRQTDMRTKLFQECRVTRKSEDTVIATLREYGGSRFKISVSLSARTITLLEPDLSWMGNADDFPVIVASKIVKMLSAKQSSKKTIFVRYTEVIIA